MKKNEIKTVKQIGKKKPDDQLSANRIAYMLVDLLLFLVLFYSSNSYRMKNPLYHIPS